MKQVLTTAVCFLCAVSICAAQEGGGVMGRVRGKLKQYKAAEKVAPSTAIAGIRGAEEKEGDDIFWAGNDAVGKDELEMFKSGFDKAERGEKDGARSSLEIFLRKYPRSPLSRDAHELMKSLGK